MTSSAPKESGTSLPASLETAKLVVSQPKKLESLLTDLQTLESFSERVSEKTGEDRSGDLGGAGGMVATTGGGTQVSARDAAIAAMPTSPKILQQKLTEHIRKEVHSLEHIASRTASASRPGDACRLNKLYARIRRLNVLLAELFDASIDVLKRFFIRVFIDKQPIL